MSDGWYKTDRGWRKSYGPARESVAPGNYPMPQFITDSMPPTEHVDGKHYDSKSAFRAVTKARGYEEIGNDTARFKAPKPQRDTRNLDAALHKAIAANT